MPSQFLTNYTDILFVDKIRENLKTCQSFHFSVSFIKKAGLDLIISDIEAALERGAEGKLITSTYQDFTDIDSLRTFWSFSEKYPKFSCHLDNKTLRTKDSSLIGFHSKGYLFAFEKDVELIVGSSNITRSALKTNIEWDIVVSDQKTYDEALEKFLKLWKHTPELTQDIITQYSKKLYYSIDQWDENEDFSQAKIKPNFMQKKALMELKRYRTIGQHTALVIAAAGSGKTYLAAFDALSCKPKKLLYIVHNGSILEKSYQTFQRVFGHENTFGRFYGEAKEIDADFLFATNISMGKSLALFRKDEFDYIIFDECHHMPAESYKKIKAYFEPKFLLGITATPERMDDQDVFSIFQNNVPYELRLRDAIIHDLIVPFHYYGIRDQLVNYDFTKNEDWRFIKELGNPEHTEFIISEIEKHRPSGKLKALAFCRDVTHARNMSEWLSVKYKTTYLTGKNTINERKDAYERLQDDQGDIEIICTVDILNEGVDIPGINMVLFLRPTESSTIFIQQLGRGLRKYENKEYVTVLDFIGNSYKRSTQIAFALGGLAENLVLEKRLLVDLVKTDFEAIGLEKYGVEIHIDSLSKEEIIDMLEKENFNTLTYLKKDYANFKKYINAEFYPKHMDYLNCDYAPDILRFLGAKIDGKKNYSYYNFLKGIDEDNLPVFSGTQINFINYLSSFLPLVRLHEYQIYEKLLQRITNISELKADIPEKEFEHAIQFMLNSGYVEKKENALFLDVDIDADLSEYIFDLIEYGKARYEIEYGDNSDFKLWKSYRKTQVQLKLLKNPGAIQKGTYIYGNTVVIFASLNKDPSLPEHLQYKDKFLKPNCFRWECEAGISKEEQQSLINSTQALIFIRKVIRAVKKTENAKKNSEEDLPFIYIGKGKLTNPTDSKNPKGSLLFDIQMENELPDYLECDFGLSK